MTNRFWDLEVTDFEETENGFVLTVKIKLRKAEDIT